MTVTLTEVAELRFRTFLRGTAQVDEFPDRGIRVSVKDGGCNGYEYVLNIIDTPSEDDLPVESSGVPIYVDRQSATLLAGVVIDYVEDLMQGGFKFSNPNATDTCGCGQSFQAGDCTPAATPCS